MTRRALTIASFLAFSTLPFGGCHKPKDADTTPTLSVNHRGLLARLTFAAKQKKKEEPPQAGGGAEDGHGDAPSAGKSVQSGGWGGAGGATGLGGASAVSRPDDLGLE